MMQPVRYELRDYLFADHRFHLGRTVVSRTRFPVLHTHDFPEVFWIEDGTGYHAVNGAHQLLVQGTLSFIRPADRHAFAAEAGHALTIRNIAFPPNVMEQLVERHGGGLPFMWDDRPLPRSVRLGADSVVRLMNAFDDALSSPHRLLDLDWLLLNVIRESNRGRVAGDLDRRAPAWLLTALNKFASDPALLRTGRTALVELCAKSREHVNRSIQRSYGVTLSGFVNRARIDYASHVLRSADTEIAALAEDIGFESLGHFYRHFKQRFGLPPGEYRRRTDRIVNPE